MLTKTDETTAPVVAEVVTASPLSDAVRSRLTEKLSSDFGKVIELDERIDPRLIGGIRVSVLGRLFDSSIATQLDEVKLKLFTDLAEVNDL
jgi:F-type H+-transporting ATPase subunit delta